MMRNISYLSCQPDCIYKYKVLIGLTSDDHKDIDPSFIKKIIKYYERGWVISNIKYVSQKGYPNKKYIVMKREISEIESFFKKTMKAILTLK